MIGTLDDSAAAKPTSGVRRAEWVVIELNAITRLVGCDRQSKMPTTASRVGRKERLEVDF